MKPANEAKKDTMESVNTIEVQVNTLMSYFENGVAEATKQGKFNLDPLKLMESQAKPEVINQVEKKLKALGYKLSKTTYNADRTTTLTLSWN